MKGEVERHFLHDLHISATGFGSGHALKTGALAELAGRLVNDGALLDRLDRRANAIDPRAILDTLRADHEALRDRARIESSVL